MFSSLFGKKRSSPVEDDMPPIPGARTDEGYVLVDPTSPRSSGIYPSIGGAGVPLAPYPQRPAPAIPSQKSVDHTFHYLQGVPFQLSRELQMATNKDTFSTEIGDLLAFLTGKINMSGYNYDFSVEKSVIKEC